MTLATMITAITPAASVQESQQRTCSHCGARGTGSTDGGGVVQQQQQQRIQELEAQVKMLTSKATAAVDKLADCEDELRRLRALQNGNADKPDGSRDVNNSTSAVNNGNAHHNNNNNDSTDTAASSSSVSRFTSILGVRRQGSNPKRENPSQSQTSQLQPPASTSASTSASSALPTPRETSLEAALAHEQTLRRQAEGQLTQVNGELEDMSAQLFEQANEMVASERKARAKLEERVEMLERRDGEKRKRLERLEGALRRIDRVKGLIGE